MNAFQSISFIDKATPQQLQQMVAARNPYSYLALSRLQTIRDNKLKEDAKQPESPPLSQVIPQQLAQLESKGIASLPQQAPPPQMPPQMPPGMPPQMPPGLPPQQPPMQSGIGEGMAAAGAAGGLVSFKHGGIAHFLVGGNSFSQEYGGGDTSYESPSIPTGTQIDDYLDNLRRQGKPISIGIVKDLQSGKIPIPKAPATPIAAPTTSVAATNPGQIGLNAFRDWQASQAGTPTEAPKAPGTTGTTGTPGTPGIPGAGMFGREIADLAKAREKSLVENERLVKENAFDPIKDVAARGDIEKDAEAAHAKLKNMFPDPNSEARKNLSAIQAENKSDIEKAPYSGLLRMSLSLMATTSPYFLQAVGKAGGEGLQEYQTIQEHNKKRRDSLIQSEAQMSAAQDARNRGLYSESRNLATEAQKSRMDAYNAERNAKTAQAGLMMQINGQRAGIPAERLQNLMEATKTTASVAQAMKLPDAIRTMTFLENNPQFKKVMQDQKTVQDVVEQVGRAQTTWEQDKKIAASLVTNGQMVMSDFQAQYGEAAKNKYLDDVRLGVLKSTSMAREALKNQATNPRPFPNIQQSGKPYQPYGQTYSLGQ